MCAMKKSRIVKSWASLGDAKPSYGEYEREMNRPMRMNRYGFVGATDILDYVFREDFCWEYFRIRHMLCSLRVTKLKAEERRPKYYAAENERRRALAAERRRIHTRTTTNPCPPREAVREAWNRRRDSHEAAIRFGSILEDLECYLDNSLRRDESGVIVGRNPGIKGWLRDNLPEISEKYTTAMRYKAAAKKLKQVVELSDPTPADVVLPPGAEDGTEKDKRDYGENENNTETGEVPELAVVRARAIWMEIVRGTGRSATALIARIDALTDPERVKAANMLAEWRERYVNEITERTRKRWWRRMLKHLRKDCDKVQVEAGKKRKTAA